MRSLRHVFLLIPIVLLLACGGDDAEGDPDGDEDRVPPAVEVLPARSGGLPLEEELNGVVKARNQVAIRPEIDAVVTEVLVRSGETVRAGQVLVRLDAEGLSDELLESQAGARQATASAAEARAQVAEIEAQVSRTRALHAEGLVSDMELETQEAQIDAARARAEQAAAEVDQAQAAVGVRRTATGKTVVRAPISGRVGRRNAEVGMLVDPSTVLFMVGDFQELIVEVPLTEKMLGHVEEGTPVLIRADALGPDALEAEMTRISPFLEEGSFSTTGEIDIENRGGRLRPGMFVAVDVLYGRSEEATLVPASAIWEDPESGELGVYVMEGGAGPDALPEAVRDGREISAETHTFELRPIQVRAEGEASAGVVGVQPGEWVVSVGQHMLYDAQRGRSGRGDRGGRGGRGARGGGQRTAAADSDAPAGPPRARVRGASWDDVMALQRLQREDLLEGFLEKQRAVAREFGAEIPEDPTVVDDMLAERERQNDGKQGGT
jgi:RND family efflux transporter MFP subunit